MAGFSNLYRVADLEEARITVLLVSLRNSAAVAGNDSVRFFGVNTRLGGCTHY